MVSHNAYFQYQENIINTSRSEELVLMLYNGLVKFIMQAQKHLEEKDIQSAHEKILKAQNIVKHLKDTLDMKYEVSINLDLMYEYMYNRLIKANIKKDKKILDEMLGFAKEFRDTWSNAMKLARMKQSLNQNIQREPRLEINR